MCTYGTPVEKQEQAVIRKIFPNHEIIDPGSYEDNEEKLLGGMNYCLKLVETCDALAYSRIRDKVTAGVGKEAKHALALGKPVYELVSNGVRQVFRTTEFCLEGGD